MDKKGKAKRPVCKMYASQAAARSEATSKPSTAPRAPKEPKKKPIFIDLTADSESEDTTRASSETHFSSVASCSEGHSTPRLTPMDKAMIDASAGGALMNKTPEEAWELIESVTDNHQCLKTRDTSSGRGVYEIAPSETTVLANSLTDIASMLREMKENQQVTPKLLTQPSQSSPPP
ncbi:hypothetical protein PIB30_049332 [Stylosanthes scabra]|uniref:Uncharacterized protein n=1 Tax=Stylosanthes scabra TaxID=79078 RepID=A0ABU6XFP7_9FABA|nr:hypothetical protein [Stylosanthes scabra]